MKYLPGTAILLQQLGCTKQKSSFQFLLYLVCSFATTWAPVENLAEYQCQFSFPLTKMQLCLPILNGFMSQSMDLPPKQGEIITASVRLAVLNLCFVLVSGVPGLAVGTELRLELLFG